MTVAAQIDSLRDYPSRASADFMGQLDRVRRLRERMGRDLTQDEASQDRGIDRSKELTPIQRPAILRTIAGYPKTSEG
jgi:hypothetical protein